MGRRTIVVVFALLLAAASVPSHAADQAAPAAAIVGTWHVKVAESVGGFPPFEALHTFHADGTFTETSSNRATLTEGPAHGVWNVRGNRINLTFQLFVFESGKTIGRVRVRCAIRMRTLHSLEAETEVDFIDPNGNVIPAIDSGPFTATRVRVVPIPR